MLKIRVVYNGGGDWACFLGGQGAGAVLRLGLFCIKAQIGVDWVCFFKYIIALAREYNELLWACNVS